MESEKQFYGILILIFDFSENVFALDLSLDVKVSLFWWFLEFEVVEKSITIILSIDRAMLAMTYFFFSSLWRITYHRPISRVRDSVI